ncbi:MAG: HAMP domain-containing sensor histidine kinase [Micropepsaceae bacterium]
MNAPTDSVEAVTAPALSPDAELRVRHLETASRYLYTNLLPLPLVVVGLALLLSQWNDAASLAVWAAGTIATWSITIATLYFFLHDERRHENTTRWTLAICVTLFISSSLFAGVSPLFWVDGERLNNVVLYVVVAAGLAGAGAQASPSIPVAIANLTPYAFVFLYLSLAHESYPTSVGIALLQLCYVVLVALYAKAVWQLADEMLRLRIEKRALIDKLQNALVATTAAQQKAETASRAKSEFLANMSHELRTPLNAVLGFSEIIKDRVFGDDAHDRYAEYGEHIHTSGKHLLALIGDILDLSKIEAGKRDLDEAPVDLREQAAYAMRFIALQAEKKTLTLKLDAPRAVVLRADERAIRQIFVNLLSNAVKFTPACGSVTLSLAAPSDGDISIVVRDSGPGIKPEELERVLERFGQARHDVASPNDQGTGLGLPIVQGLVALHGGALRLDSKFGDGTTVTVTLPANRLLPAQSNAA